MRSHNTHDHHRRRPRFAVTALAALGVAIALLGAGTISPHSARLTSGATNLNLRLTRITSFDARTSQPVASVTVVNIGTVPIPIADVTTSADRLATSPWVFLPGEDCIGATIGPNGYCVVSLTMNSISNGINTTGNIVVTAADGTTRQETLAGSDTSTFAPAADPLQADFGSMTVGTTSGVRQVTVHAGPVNGDIFVPLGASTVDIPKQPAGAGDYHVTDACNGLELFVSSSGPSQPTCQIGVSVTPGATGSRPAFLDVTYCDRNSFNVGTPSGGGSQVPLPPPAAPPGKELVCGGSDGPSTFVYADHLLVALTANGTSAPPPPGNPFAPTLTANPAVAPAGRTTQITGTGFPDNTAVTLALVPIGTPPNANLATIPGATSVTTNGIGGFTNKILLIMPHTPPGHYELRAATPGATATLAFLVAPGIQEPPKFVNRH
ncbi:MAG TPA: hypothetical protein VGD84_04315 [Pseudonocardiaceae bacterium]